MDKDLLKYEFGKESEEEVRQECICIIKNIQSVLDIKNLDYIERFLYCVKVK